ncbi:sugar ABC transporter permease [Vallitalea longa]|uniref:Sugar ABC transporter permease n=1 Tax=Vallitalea longa TaxID=2936439 RepID=A0A9W6DHF2_9FIRM|nr:sugar ABC transporter permease [Vallitalea longa]GKX31502.1 sugar ABC transporter permease [Vallitalea longa]
MIKTKSIAKKSKITSTKGFFLTVCVAPAFILYLILGVYPAINVFFNSFFKWSGLSPVKTFIGIDNFRTLFHDKKFGMAFQNTIFIMVVTTVFTMVLALFFASVLSRSRLKEKNVYRVIFFFPNVLSIVVIGVLFTYIYEPNRGILNAALKLIGLNGPTWLGDSQTVLWAIAGAMIWQAVGYYMVMYMAGMDSISPSLYEVADLEGATKLQQFFKITVPMLWEIIRVTMVFFIISSLNMSFLFVTVMTNGGPSGSSEVLLSYMYRQAFTNSNFGYAMAVAVVVFLFAFTLAIISNKLTEKENDNY